MTERARCPACGSTAFLRAVEVREFKIRTGLAAWLWGVMAQTTIGANALCANPACSGLGDQLRIDRDGVRRLHVVRPHAPEPPPAERAEREPIPMNRTPGMQWTREGRG